MEPANSKQLREELKTNKPILFTLIHKFRYDKGKKYPILSERDDIIVIVDEAHRTQYKDLAENMRTDLPNVQFLAFTGTPLLGSKRLTNAWFGDYDSPFYRNADGSGSTWLSSKLLKTMIDELVNDEEYIFLRDSLEFEKLIAQLED